MSRMETSQLDEGYTEDEEDFFYKFGSGPSAAAESTSTKLGPSSSSHKNQDLKSCTSLQSITATTTPLPPPPPPSNPVQHQEDDEKPILSWDRLQIPLPYRHLQNHVQLAQSTHPPKTSPNFILDSVEKSATAVDLAWKLRDGLPHFTSSSPQKNLPPIPIYISVQEFIQSVLDLLAGRGSPTFILNEDTGQIPQFEKNPAILVHGISPSALWNFSGPFLRVGNIVTGLDKLWEVLYKGNYECPATIVDTAFVQFTLDYVKIFRTILMLNHDKIKSFTGLLSFLRPFRHQLELLHKIWFDKKAPHDSSAFLSSINWLLLTESAPTSLALIKNVFVTCASAYLRHVSDWVFRGQLPPERSKWEFFITKLKENPYRDRRFWSKQFKSSSNEREIPAFLSESWKTVFEAGKAVNFLKQIQKETKFSSKIWDHYTMMCDIPDHHQMLIPIFSFEDLQNLHKKWGNVLVRFKASSPRESKNQAMFLESINATPARNTSFEGSTIRTLDFFQDEVENNADNAEEEKLDPNKFITTPPPPYVISHIKNSHTTSTELFEKCKQPTSPHLLKFLSSNQQNNTSNPHILHLFLSQSVSLPAKVQCTMANLTLLQYFIYEKNLLHHVTALNNFLCLQNGLFGHKLTELLIHEVDSLLISKSSSQTDISSRMGHLNFVLLDAVITGEGEELSSNLSFTRNTDDIQGSGGVEGKRPISSPYQCLNSIKLVYNVNWPLNVVLTDELLSYFERVFLLQMRLLRAELLLQGVFLKFKPTRNARGKSTQMFILQSYRSRLHHFVRTIRNYINVTVIQVAWTELTCSWEDIDSLVSIDKIYESLVRHIKSIHTNCLLGTKAEGVMKLLMSQLVIIEAFCTQLQTCLPNPSSDEISEQDFKKLTQKFKAVEEIGKVFVEVAYKLVQRGYYPKVSYFLELYNFNGFFTQNKGKEESAATK